jgi:acetoin:2,6-dichlorophenolindophenol oxidoreductase subunit beta
MTPRPLSYSAAIREAFTQLLESDPRVFVIGQGVWNPWYVGTSMQDLDKRFGRRRIIDSPISEAATTGAAIGAAVAGMRPVVIHPRMDFLLLAADQVVNQAANWSSMFGGRARVPVVIRAIVNRGGAQGAQHAQALQGWFMHVPGLKVVMPATPRDAKGLLLAAARDGNPVVYIDDRWLYDEVEDVPETAYTTPIGRAFVRREGADATIVATSYLVREATLAAAALAQHGADVELIDLRSIKPLDTATVIASVRKTGRLVVADPAWRTGGVAAEVIARVAEEAPAALRAPPRRVTLPDAPAPASPALERRYYPMASDVEAAVWAALGRGADTRRRGRPQ